MSELFQRIGLAFKCFFVVVFAGRLPGGIPRRYFDAIPAEDHEIRIEGRVRDAAGASAATATGRAEPTKHPAAPAPAAGGASVLDQLKELAGLKDAGILDDAEFAAAKAKILGT